MRLLEPTGTALTAALLAGLATAWLPGCGAAAVMGACHGHGCAPSEAELALAICCEALKAPALGPLAEKPGVEPPLPLPAASPWAPTLPVLRRDLPSAPLSAPPASTAGNRLYLRLSAPLI
jgi:hypothetical protein